MARQTTPLAFSLLLDEVHREYSIALPCTLGG